MKKGMLLDYKNGMNRKTISAIHLAVAIMLLLGMLLGLNSCVHDPVLPDNTPPPPDTTIINPPDTTGMGGHPCDPDSIYFEKDILPILISNCAISGCHDPISAQDNVILNSYSNAIATADVRPFDPSGSDIYEVLVETDPDKRMPPQPRSPLSQEQIFKITLWINQGAQNLTCDEDTTCVTTNISYTNTVSPIIQTYCRGCHSGPTPQGGISLETHAQVAVMGTSGILYGAIDHQPGFSPMPKGGSKLSQCKIDQIKSWIDAGAPNN